jgi:rsbT co-antagonist protein RsbR
MDAYGGQRRMAAYLRNHHDKVAGRWAGLVAAEVRGRISPDEVRNEVEDLYALLRVMTLEDERAMGELRAALDELSHSRARNGFTPSQTALGVFSAKDAVYELVIDAAELVPEYLIFSRMIDDLGLRVLETYSAAREQTLLSTGAEQAAIDVTGVAAVATEVAQRRLKTVGAARLELRERLAPVLEVVHDERREDRIEAGRREWQRICEVGLVKRNTGAEAVAGDG